MAPHPVDIHVGRLIRLRRKQCDLSQEELGESIGVSFQQVQKYERGTNRVAPSRLFEISIVLNVHVIYFFQELYGDDEPSYSALSPIACNALKQCEEAQEALRKLINTLPHA